MVTIVMMPAKMAYLGLLEIDLFWNKSYDIIISALDINNKILSRDSYYTVDVLICPKFVNYSISVREVITFISI